MRLNSGLDRTFICSISSFSFTFHLIPSSGWTRSNVLVLVPEFKYNLNKLLFTIDKRAVELLAKGVVVAICKSKKKMGKYLKKSYFALLSNGVHKYWQLNLHVKILGWTGHGTETLCPCFCLCAYLWNSVEWLLYC